MRSIGGRLEDFLAAYSVRPFDWASNNCAHFVHEWYVFICQKECLDVLPPFASYKDTRRWFQDCEKSFGDIVTAKSNMQTVSIAYASIGDIVLVSMREGDVQALGIYQGPQTLVIDPEGRPNLLTLPIAQAWRLPNVCS